MDGPSVRFAVGALGVVASLCIVGMVVAAVLGKDAQLALAIAVSLAGIGGNCTGGIIGLLVPTGRHHEAPPVVTVPAAVTPGAPAR